MNNVTALPGVRNPAVPRETLIKALEEALTLAKSGELQCFIGVGFTHDTRWSIRAIHGENVCKIVGAIEMMKNEIITTNQ